MSEPELKVIVLRLPAVLDVRFDANLESFLAQRWLTLCAGN